MGDGRGSNVHGGEQSEWSVPAQVFEASAVMILFRMRPGKLDRARVLPRSGVEHLVSLDWVGLSLIVLIG
ncbi:hypothetical protein ES702_03656 [subsurface metagenome]